MGLRLARLRGAARVSPRPAGPMAKRSAAVSTVRGVGKDCLSTVSYVGCRWALETVPAIEL
jgi:hypothetical protein